MRNPLKPVGLVVAGIAVSMLGAATAEADYTFTFAGTIDVVDALAVTPLGDVVNLMPDVNPGDPIEGGGTFRGHVDPSTGEIQVEEGTFSFVDLSPGSSLGFTAPLPPGRRVGAISTAYSTSRATARANPPTMPTRPRWARTITCGSTPCGLPRARGGSGSRFSTLPSR